MLASEFDFTVRRENGSKAATRMSDTQSRNPSQR